MARDYGEGETEDHTSREEAEAAAEAQNRREKPTEVRSWRATRQLRTLIPLEEASG